MKILITNCIYCKKEDIYLKHSNRKTHKCKDCHKIWHKLRTRKNKFGENTTLDELVIWYINQEQKCKECGSKKKITIDRIVPESMNGKYEVGNVQLLCYSCNCLKKTNHKSVTEGMKNDEYKVCTTCKQKLPLTKDFFHKTAFKAKYRKNSLSMWHPICKKCRLIAASYLYMLKHKPTRLNKIKYKENYENIYGEKLVKFT